MRRREAIRAALAAAFNEQPVPTVADVARRLGYATVKPVTSRFPELSMQLRASRRRVTQKKSGHRVSEGVRQKITEAFGEFPPPSCAEVVRRIPGHRTQIREDFPDLWHALRDRYVQHKREVHRSEDEKPSPAKSIGWPWNCMAKGFFRLPVWCSQLFRSRSSGP